MQVGEYRVAIISEQDPLAMGTDIYVYRRGVSDIEVLQQDGQWLPQAEGTRLQQPSLRLPSGAIEALIDAVDRYRGAPSHARTEAAVLREWLKVEQGRVDAMIQRLAQPIVFDTMPKASIIGPKP